MKEKNILNVALLISIVGIIVLYLFSSNTKISSVNIENIENLEGMYKIKGTVADIKNYNSSAKITIVQPKEIEVLLFKSNNLSIPKNIEVEIEVEKKNDMIVGHSIKYINPS